MFNQTLLLDRGEWLASCPQGTQ